MNKQELIRAIAAKTCLANVSADDALSALGTIVVDALNTEGEITLPGIGKLKISYRAGRTGRNPKTGEPLVIDGKTVVKFSAAKALKDAVA